MILLSRQPLEIIDCGVSAYRPVLERQLELQDLRREGKIVNTVLIVEHEPVVTLGARESNNRLTVSRDELLGRGVDVVEIRRGGGSTAHNPGQMVFYPILNINEMGLGVNEYVRELEQIGIELLEKFGIAAERRKGFPGLWVGERKVASIGVRVSRGITHHGMAINIINDLTIFDCMIPCGIDGVEMTSVYKVTGEKVSMADVKKELSSVLITHFCKEADSNDAAEKR